MARDLTSDCIWGCTTFYDHVSDYVYVHLMRNFTLEETLLAKKAYEKFLACADSCVKHYHANNGRFSGNGFLWSVNEHDQTITFCGVGAHHQNGNIENKNKALTLGARTLLLQGMRYWPQMIDTIFWPFTVKSLTGRMNGLNIDLNSETPESKMYGVSLDEIPSSPSTPCTVQSMSSVIDFIVLDELVHPSGNQGPALVCTSAIPHSTQGA
jgi:hypothetical protein